MSKRSKFDDAEPIEPEASKEEWCTRDGCGHDLKVHGYNPDNPNLAPGSSCTADGCSCPAFVGPSGEPGTVKEVEQDFEPSTAPAEQLAAWAKIQHTAAGMSHPVVSLPADVAITFPDGTPCTAQTAPPLKRWAVRLTNHGTLLIDAPDAEAAKAEYNRQRGIVRSDHAYSIEPATEG